MEIINKKENQIVFKAEIDESLANSIRRYLNQIPILAIDEVEISKNDSALYDETIAHRIGLVPIKSDKAITEKTNSKMKLNTKNEGVILSGEIVGEEKVVFDKIPLTILKKGQELNIEATVRAGKGSKHSKFSPGLMFYRNGVDVKIEKDCPQEVVDSCPKRILKSKDGRVVVEDVYKCDMCEACTEICKKMKKDSIKLIPTKELIITLESFGQMDYGNMFKKSVELLKKDLADVAKKIK